MKKITQDAINAFNKRKDFKRSNTQVKAYNGGVHLYLHGNHIAHREFLPDGETRLYISNAGWQSNTTKERLNGLTGVNIRQKNWVWYLNGDEWNGEWKEIEIDS